MARAKSTAPPSSLNFRNDRVIDSLPILDKRYELSDQGSDGLRLRVEPTGTRTFVWRYRKVTQPGESPKWGVKTLGKYRRGVYGVHDAREALREAKKNHRVQLTLGIPEGQVETVADLVEDFYPELERRRQHPKIARRIIETDILPQIGKVKLDDVTTVLLGRVVKRVAARGAPTAASKVYSLLVQLFRHARGNGYIHSDPTEALDPGSLGASFGEERDRTLSAEEIAEFWQGLDGAGYISDQIRIGLKLLLLLGVRSGELRRAEWRYVDFDAGTWTIPVEHQKLKKDARAKARPFVVPLSDMAQALFNELRAIAGDSPYVMASKRSNTDIMAPKAFSQAMRRMRARGALGSLEDLTPHDLRRSLRTHLGQTLDVDPFIAERCLNHRIGGKVERTYDRGDYLDKRREALSRWADFIDRTVHGGNVIEMGTRA